MYSFTIAKNLLKSSPAAVSSSFELMRACIACLKSSTATKKLNDWTRGARDGATIDHSVETTPGMKIRQHTFMPTSVVVLTIDWSLACGDGVSCLKTPRRTFRGSAERDKKRIITHSFDAAKSIHYAPQSRPSTYLAAQRFAAEFSERVPQGKKGHNVIQRPPVHVETGAGLRRSVRRGSCRRHNSSHSMRLPPPWKDPCGKQFREGGARKVVSIKTWGGTEILTAVSY